ncbi:TetR/AcrR family transcriptional regulator [Microbacterium sp. CIAB417]|uniref:TetR/AcrR family transcriptional regulator n=1 Tax=Microbacterium sp. CIAB417 TaxID=2860287 RepID=UPI001FACBD8D|nr:TetR family transcriptional regulator [Microbacterium sp. CIAB417]
MATSPARTRTRKSPAQRSGEIHDAALGLAREQGLSALTLRSVAARAGVASGLVAHYATSMDDLIARTFRELTAGELDDVRRQADASDDAAGRMAVLIATVLGRDHDDITLVWVDAWSLGRGSAALSAAIDEQMQAWQSYIAGIIRDGRIAGMFAVDDEEAVAWQILAMIDGLSAHALTRGTDAALFAARLAQACETLVGAAAGTIVSRLPSAT